MSKNFLYIEGSEGGIGDHWEFDIDFEDDCTIQLPIIGWMEGSCEVSDRELIRWCREAGTGEYTEHRMGIVVCLDGGFPPEEDE